MGVYILALNLWQLSKLDKHKFKSRAFLNSPYWIYMQHETLVTHYTVNVLNMVCLHFSPYVFSITNLSLMSCKYLSGVAKMTLNILVIL